MAVDASEFVPDEKRSLEVDIPEHEVLLSFTDDEQAEAFLEWWNRFGVETFCSWVEAGRPLEVAR
tara:strand:- start:5 stop:199 length:195 start_codon:yes stop_codon:yes gene_type:complete